MYNIIRKKNERRVLMRTVFDEKLAELHRDLLELGVLVNRANI